jgi:4-amino-4-deoxy-L-arabinose transferase-like glycosyltransferase
MHSQPPIYRKVFWILFLAFAVRLAVRSYSGSEDFWVRSFGFYFGLAKNITAGNFLRFGRDPLYPVFLAAITFGQKVFLPIVVSQSFIGVGTVLCAALMARKMFGSTAAITAAAITALYPYYVVHDTALQETSLFTLLTALAVLLLLRVRCSGSGITAAYAGVALGAAVLTRFTLAPFALFAPLWLAIPGVFHAGPWRRACWIAVICGGAMALTLAPWVIWSSRLAGSAISQTGYVLWVGNNPYTFSHYPYESIDRSRDLALEALPPHEVTEITELAGDGAAEDQWFRRHALAYMLEQPGSTFIKGMRKIATSFGWLPSPRRGFWPNLVYFLSYSPVMVLGLWGMWVGRRNWREHLIFYALFLSFAIITALFWGHTSHRAYLDVYLVVFAAGTLYRLQNKYFPFQAAVLIPRSDARSLEKHGL